VAASLIQILEMAAHEEERKYSNDGSYGINLKPTEIWALALSCIAMAFYM